MRTTLRLGVAILAIAMLAAPVAYSVSTRPAHDAYFDVFVPEESDRPAEIVHEATVNCGDPSVPDQSAATHATSHDGTSELRGGTGPNAEDNFNSEMPCWDTDEHSLWTDEDGKILSGSPPFYTCKADGVDLDIGIQNPFPMYVPDPAIDDPDRFGDKDEHAFAREHAVLLASGSFYVIPELSGEDADQVEAIWFNYLQTTPTAPLAGAGGGTDETCASLDRHAATASGAYYEFFRGDTDKSDGWTIPINTLLVPDNAYGAKLAFLGHSDELDEAGLDEGDLNQPYPGGLEVLAMGYAYAITANDADDTTWEPCEPTRMACDNQDTTPPWPQVVPGDVPLESVEDPSTLTVTFGEHVIRDSVDILVNGLDQGHGDIDHDQAGTDAVALMTVTTDDWGERFEISLDDELGPCDEVTVTARDLHGNKATKTTLADEDACPQT